MSFKSNNLAFFIKTGAHLPNRWDILALALVLSFLGMLVWSGSQMAAPYQIGDSLPISLAPEALPRYAALTILRMVVALLFSLLFTLVVGTWAAKRERAAKIIIPCIDILQSVPVLGFLSLTITGFIRLFPGNRLGPECAAIFAIFTAQAWNMCLSFYQSLRAVPADLVEATTLMQLSAWQRFWRLEVPFALPSLLWNMMLSMSGSWVFLVASESISIANQHIHLPGIGSYLSLAIVNAEGYAVLWAVGTMLTVILLYDQLFFRPLGDWSHKFTLDNLTAASISQSWMTIVLQRTYVLKNLHYFMRYGSEIFINLGRLKQFKSYALHRQKKRFSPVLITIAKLLQYLLLISASLTFLAMLLQHIDWHESGRALLLGAITGLRVMIVVFISLMIWVPIGVWVGLRPHLTHFIQPVVQFLAAFPANVLFPFFVASLLKWNLPIEMGVLPLMLFNAQWYILFNVIAGAKAIPGDLHQMSENFGLKRWIWWRRLILPGIFPHLVTGIMTAVGSAWNISVIAEVMSWGAITLSTTGLGAYISQASDQGNFPQVAIGMVVMSFCVLFMNYLLWQPLYRLAQSKYRLN